MLKKHLKTVVLLNIFVETAPFMI